MKKCLKCEVIKPVTDFTKLSRNKDGLHARCKLCKRLSEKNMRLANHADRLVKERAHGKKRYTNENTQVKLKAYREATRERKQEYDKTYRKENADRIATYKREWCKERRRTNKTHVVKRNLRRRIHHLLLDGYKSATTEQYIGCTYEEFVCHIENQFEPGMSWDNYGLGSWHLDHIIPCYLYDLSNFEDQMRCFNYRNHRPLWEVDNLSRSRPQTVAELRALQIPNYPQHLEPLQSQNN